MIKLKHDLADGEVRDRGSKVQERLQETVAKQEESDRTKGGMM